MCLLPVPAGHDPDGLGGVAVSWTTHDLLSLDWDRGREYQGTQRTMNCALAGVLKALGYQVRPFGVGGASLVAGSRHSSRAEVISPGTQGGAAEFQPRRTDAALCRLADVSEPVRDVPADSDAVRAAVANACRGVITHLTIAGERVAAIVPESVIEADAAWDEPGESIPLEELEVEFGH